MSDQPEVDYLSVLAGHIEQQTEGSLSQAYEFGRRALARGLGILDVFSLYGAAQKSLVFTPEQTRAAAAVADFFRELLSPFEMSFRGYREANRDLQRANAELKLAYAALQQKQQQLVQSAKMASLGELVAGIAHEINNPLAFISSHLHTAGVSLEKIQDESAETPATKANELLDRARDRIRESALGAERIRDLVLKLRTFSRLDEGEQKQASIRESVGSVLTILEHRCKGRIRVATHFGYPDVVECFPGPLNQAIMNLVSNAIDAIENTGTITITTGADAGSYVIAVADTGHGIPARIRDRVLEPFFTTKPVGQGTGLGLSITHSIVERHRGTLELAPAEGGGTVVTIRFPVNQHGA